VRLEPVVEQNVVSYVTVIDVSNPDLELKPGMTANVTIEVARADEVLRVPNAALRFRPTTEVLTAIGLQAPDGKLPARPDRAAGAGGSRAGVWILREGRLVHVPVTAGITDGAVTEVVGGSLGEGAQVVTAASPQTGAAPAQRSASPLLPQRPSRSRPAGGQR
jgi:HlyD family secretion protein